MARVSLSALLLSACCLNGLPGRLPTASLAYTPDPWLPTWGAGYEPSLMADGVQSTYWCAPSGVSFPIVGNFQLAGPATIASIDFDTRVAGYESSGIHEVSIEPLGAGGVPLGVPVRAFLYENTLSTVPVAAVGVTAVRITFLSNHGGGYAALAELAIRSDLGIGAPPAPPPAYPTPPVVPSVPSAPAFPSAVRGVPYATDSVESFSGYGPELMRDGNPATYWCTPSTPTFPVTLTLSFPTPTTISAIEIDSSIPGYATIGPSDVTFLGLSETGAMLGLTNARANASALTVIPLSAPLSGVSRLRVTLQDYYGGPYLGVGELVVLP